jgi:hypothetical protein
VSSRKRLDGGQALLIRKQFLDERRRNHSLSCARPARHLSEPIIHRTEAARVPHERRWPDTV